MAWPDIILEFGGKLFNDYIRLNTYFATIKGLWNAHIGGTADKHAAEHIAYSGRATGEDVKSALDNIHNRINTIVASAGDSNTEIVDARGSEVVLRDRLDKYDAQLAENALQIYAPALDVASSVRPKCAYSTLWNNLPSLSSILALVDNCIGMFDYVSHSIYCYYNIATHAIEHRLEGGVTVTDIVSALEYSAAKGMPVRVIKIHQTLPDIVADVGFEEAINKYKTFIDNIVSTYGHLNPEYITIMNEDYNSYTNPTYETGIISLLDYVRSKGYRAGITYRTSSTNQVPANIVNACDGYFMNWYPVMSIKKNRTTYSDVETAFAQYAKREFGVLKALYPDKEIIVSEFGLCSNWLALEYPETYYSLDDYPDTYSLVPAYWVFKAFMEIIAPYIKEFWIWYYVDTCNNTNCRNLFSQYIKY